MANASGNRVQLAYVAETTHGTTPASPTLKVLRSTTRNVNLQKNMLESAEIRPDRQKVNVRHGFQQVGGSVGFELSVSAYDDWLAALLGGTWAAVTVSGTPNFSVSTTSKFTRSAGSWITDGFLPGDVIVTTGFTNSGNNGTFTVTAVSATDLTVGVSTLTVEAATTGRTITQPGKRLQVGTALQTFTMERQFLDLPQYQVLKGVIPNNMSLTVRPEQIVGGTFDIVGMSAATWSGSTVASALTAAPTNDPLSSFEGVLYEGGSLIGVVTGADLKVENGRNVTAVVGSKTSPDVFDGTCKVTGTLMAFFQDASLLNKFVNETASSLFLCLDDLNGVDFLNFTLPKIKYTGGDIDPPAQGPVIQSLPFEAILDPSSGTSLRIQRSNVS